MPKTFHSLDELVKALDLLDVNVLKGVRRAGYKIGQHAQNRLMQFPGKVSYPLKWASDRQRRWYFASRKDIGLPYRRESDPMSQDILKKWAVEKTPDGAIVGNSATYAPYVQSSEMQTAMHAETGWVTDAQVVEEIEKSGLIIREIESEIKSALEGL